MRESAKFGRGTYTHIADTSEVKEKMDTLYRKIESPLIDDIEVHWHGSANVELYPSRIPTLYQGEPLVITAKGKPLYGDITIEGRSGNQRWSRRLSIPGHSVDTGIGTLWARSKVADLEDEKIRGRDVREDVIAIALEHRLVTRYTSLVAVEEIVSRPPGDNGGSSPVPNAVALGQVVSKVMLPRTATRARQSLMIGLLLLAIAITLRARQRSCLQVS
jgi:Ca-activated chloride channel family protein